MRIKLVMTVILAGFLNLSANAGFEQFNDPIGAVNVYEPIGGVWQFSIVPFGMADLRAITVDNREFQLLPNINLYADNPGDPVWRNNGGAGPDGNSIVEANTLFEIPSLTADIDTVVFDFDVSAFDLDPVRYELIGFVKVLDKLSGSYLKIDGYEIVITGTGTNQIVFGSSPSYEGQLLQVGWALKGLNANPTNDWGSATVTATALYATSFDFTAPTPDPMSFYSVPTNISDTAISMTATTAVDDYNDVEYLFTNTVTHTSSGWQSSTNYTEIGLGAGTTNTYMVKARDTSINGTETGWSDPKSAVTSLVDTTPPTPPQMSFASTDVGPTMVKLVAVTASDPSGVEYYFDCVAGGGNDSGWQDSPIYYDTGVAPGSSCSYTVIARDKSSAANSNTVSAVTNVTTLLVESVAFTNSLTSFTGTTDDPEVLFQLNKIGLETGSISASARIDFDGDGATYAVSGQWGRDLLRTIAMGYQYSSLEVYATLTFSGTFDLSGFLGIGQGIQTGENGNWGVPEMQLEGVNGVVAQFKSPFNYALPNCSLFKLVNTPAVWNTNTVELLSDPVDSTETIQARLIYDSVSNTVNIAIDKNYAGGPFTVDQDLGTVSTLVTNDLVVTDMFDGAPVRVYVGGGEGTIVKDFGIVVTYSQPPQPPFDVQISSVVGGEAVLVWQGAPGRIYDVQYTSDLNAGWTTDPGASDIPSTGGAMTATSGVSGVTMFYQVLSK